MSVFIQGKGNGYLVKLGGGMYLDKNKAQKRGKLFAHTFKDLETAKEAFRFWLKN